MRTGIDIRVACRAVASRFAEDAVLPGRECGIEAVARNAYYLWPVAVAPGVSGRWNVSSGTGTALHMTVIDLFDGLRKKGWLRIGSSKDFIHCGEFGELSI